MKFEDFKIGVVFNKQTHAPGEFHTYEVVDVGSKYIVARRLDVEQIGLYVVQPHKMPLCFKIRDPRRIDRVLDKIKIHWKKYPDLRLGQLIANAIVSGSSYKLDVRDTFHVEDDIIEAGLE